MDPDELADALASAGGQSQQAGTNWDGRIAVNPRTGERLVYRVNPQGHGRFIALNAAAADPQSRQRLGDLTTRVSQGQRVLDIGRRFMDLNATAQTGGVQDDPNLPEFVRGAIAPNAQRFRSMSQQMIGANWQPGTSGMMNTAVEMAMQANRYPSATNNGAANRDAYLGMAEDLGVQQAAVQDMRQWLTQHATLDGWDDQWAQKEQTLRPQIRERAAQDFNSRIGQAQGGPRGSWGAPQGQPAADIRIDAQGRVVQ